MDIGLKRLAAMDAGGIDVQVLSLNQPATENLEPELAVKLAAMANDKIAAAVTTHPTRFGGFATLPMPDPEASAAELERMVTNHGFLGALIHGHIRGRYLDDQFFWPIFEMAEKLDVPIYLHPKRPPQAVEDAFTVTPLKITAEFSGLAPKFRRPNKLGRTDSELGNRRLILKTIALGVLWATPCSSLKPCFRP